MAEIPDAIRRFISTLATGKWADIADCYTPDAIFDASVPNWHFQWEGGDRCISQLQEWFPAEARVVECNVVGTDEGAVVDFEIRRTCPGDSSHASHLEGGRQAHIFRLAGGRIAEQRVYCAGEWGEEDLRRIDAEAPTVVRKR